MSKKIQLIIPMSGIGKRFINSGYTTPKPLIEIDGMPIIKHVINLFPGVDDISFICNEIHLQNTNMKEILHNICPSGKIYEVSNNNRKGPVDAVYKIKDLINDDMETIISYCDYGTFWNFEKFLKTCRSGNFDGSIPCYTGFHPHMLGSDNYAFCKEENKILLEIKEKEPFTNDKMNEYASNGTYYFKSGRLMKKYFKEIMDIGKDLNGEYYVSLVYNLLIRDGLKTNIFEIENMLQWGTPYDLEIYRGWSTYFSNVMKVQSKILHDENVTMILPMAGRGNRFHADRYEIPKPLLKVDELPMIVKAVKDLPISKNNIFICLNKHLENYNLSSVLNKYFPACNIIGIPDITEGQACTCKLGIEH